MHATVINACPSADADFEPLTEYQTHTPETFFNGKPVLYYHARDVKAWVANEQSSELHFFSSSGDAGSLKPTPPESWSFENEAGDHFHEEAGVEVFVGSNKLTLFSHKSGKGLEIPYPTITLHAIKTFQLGASQDARAANLSATQFLGVYMQLEFSGADGDDDDEFSDPIELTLIPAKASDPASGALALDHLNEERTKALFSQISACSNLNPDPRAEGEEDYDEDEADRIVFESNFEHEPLDGFTGAFRGDLSGGLPPPMPGSSGWITAENVNEYFDEDGNWIGGEEGVNGELGEGAGRVRARDEVEEDAVNGHGAEDDGDSKRPRTE